LNSGFAHHPSCHWHAQHPDPGLGAVATAFMAGVESIRRGVSKPIGSLTQMATIRPASGPTTGRR
jgi:hypothetical protein